MAERVFGNTCHSQPQDAARIPAWSVRTKHSHRAGARMPKSENKLAEFLLPIARYRGDAHDLVGLNRERDVLQMHSACRVRYVGPKDLQSRGVPVLCAYGTGKRAV